MEFDSVSGHSLLWAISRVALKQDNTSDSTSFLLLMATVGSFPQRLHEKAELYSSYILNPTNDQNCYYLGITINPTISKHA